MRFRVAPRAGDRDAPQTLAPPPKSSSPSFPAAAGERRRAKPARCRRRRDLLYPRAGTASRAAVARGGADSSDLDFDRRLCGGSRRAWSLRAVLRRILAAESSGDAALLRWAAPQAVLDLGLWRLDRPLFGRFPWRCSVTDLVTTVLFGAPRWSGQF
jgi:hypothetical protein